MDVDVDTGERAEGAVDVDVNTTTGADTDASGIDETGTETGMYDDTGALPDTDEPDNTGITTCGEVRDINYKYYIISIGTRYYVVTPATIFSQPDLSLEMIEVGDRVMISYVVLHEMRIAVRITVHK